jgi:TP901 family phage tail tape measure protein
MSQSQIDITADFSEIIRQFAILHGIQGDAEKSLRNYTKASATYNEVGDRVAANVRTQIAANQELIGSMKEITKTTKAGTSVVEQYRFQIVNNAKADKEAAAQKRELERAAKAAAKALQDQARAAEQARQQEIAKVQNQLRALGATGGGGPTPNDSQIAKARAYADILGRVQATLTNLALYRGFNLITKQISEAVHASQELQIKIALIRTVSQESQQTTGQWANDIKEVSNRTGIAATDIADAFNDAVQNQLSAGAGVKDFVNKAADLARVTNSSVKDSGNAIGAVMNTFGHEAGNAEEVAAKLFKTVDRGIIKIDQLAHGLGNVTFLAKDLGVELDDVLAIMASLTRSGLSTEEAMTLITNGFNKLLKPTDKLKEAFAEIGVSSGKALIQQRGLLGTMDAISQLTQSGKLDPTEVFNEIRGQKFSVFFNDQKEAIKGDLKAIRDDFKQTFQNAKELRAEPAADKIKIAFTGIQNALQTSFGDTFTKIVSQLIDLNANANELDKSFSKWGRAAVVAAAALGTGLVVLRGFAIAQEVSIIRAEKAVIVEKQLQLAKLQQAQATNVQTQAELRLAAAQARAGRGGLASFAFANPGTLGATALIAGIAAFETFRETGTNAFEETAKAVEELHKRMRDDVTTKELTKSLEITKEIRDTFKDAARVVGGPLSQALAKNNESLQGIREKIRLSNDNLRAGFVGVLDLMRNKVTDVERHFAEIPNKIDQSKKAAAEFADKLNEQRFGTLQRFATPQQSLQLSEIEIKRLQKKAEDLFAEGTDESVAEARRLFDQIGGMVVQFHEKQADLAKQQMEANIQQQLAAGQIPLQTQFIFDQTQLQKDQNAVLGQRNRLEDEYRAKLEQRREQQAAEIAKAKQEFKLTEEAINNFQNFNVFTETGQVKPQFQTPLGQIDTKKVRDQFAQVVKDVQDRLPQDVLTRLNFAGQVTQRRDLVDEETRRVVAQQNLMKAQEQSVKAQEHISKMTKDLDDQFSKAADSSKGIGANVELLAKNLKNAADTLPQVLAKVLDDTQLKTSIGRGIVGTLNEAGRAVGVFQLPNAGEFKQIAQEAEALQTELKNAQNKTVTREGRTFLDTDNLKELSARLAGLEDKLQKATDKALGQVQKQVGQGDLSKETEQQLVLLGTGLSQAKEVLRAQREQIDKTVQLQELAFQKQKELQDTVKAVKESATQVEDRFGKLYQSLGGLAGGFSTQLGNNTAELDRLGQKAEEIFQKVQGLKTATEQTKQEALQAIVGGASINRAYGGPVYRNYGGPIGRDNIMAWLSDGEYVMNPSATRRFYSQIVQYNNAGRVPQYFNNGGEVTNMGGVTINVSGAGNPGVVARDVHRVLQRGRRMGQI